MSAKETHGQADWWWLCVGDLVAGRPVSQMWTCFDTHGNAAGAGLGGAGFVFFLFLILGGAGAWDSLNCVVGVLLSGFRLMFERREVARYCNDLRLMKVRENMRPD